MGYFEVCAEMIEPLITHHPMIGIETVQCLLLNPKNVVSVLAARIASLFEGLQHTQAHLRLVLEIPALTNVYCL